MVIRVPPGIHLNLVQVVPSCGDMDTQLISLHHPGSVTPGHRGSLNPQGRCELTQSLLR